MIENLSSTKTVLKIRRTDNLSMTNIGDILTKTTFSLKPNNHTPNMIRTLLKTSQAKSPEGTKKPSKI